MVMLTAEKLDDETLLKKIPWITVDEVNAIIQNKSREEASRFTEDKSKKEAEELTQPFGGEQ